MSDFSYSYYRLLLQHIRSAGRKIVSFRDHNPADESYVILRHDIDFSLQKALEMATLEFEMGIRSTYFILLTAPYYNPLSEQGAAIIKSIAAMGHECGLHYDCSGFELLSDDQIQRRINTYTHVLADAVGVPVQTIAQHKPAKSPIRKEFPGLRNAYSPAYFTDIPYISDSRKMFRHKNLLAFFDDNPRSQLLIHPIWWHHQNLSVNQIFTHLQASSLSQYQANLADEVASIELFLSKYNG